MPRGWWSRTPPATPISWRPPWTPYIAGIGGARAGVMETTFHDETETGPHEQTVLCGGVVDLMRCGFRPAIKCIHEMKLIIDLAGHETPL